ncbi:MAG: PepSY-like domain-containing protein [Adhaeribacter sp.]
MRKALLIVVLFSLAVTAMAQRIREKQVPSQALNAFKAAFPTAKNAVWEKEGGNFEVDFLDRQGDISLTFDQEGNLLEFERKIAPSLLPPGVLEAVASSYPNHKITETAKIESGSQVTYEVELRKGWKTLDLIFNQQGLLKVQEAR